MFIWSFGSFAFFLVPFYVGTINIGNIYNNFLFSELAEFFANIVVIFVTRCMSLHNSLTMFSAVIVVGSVLMTVLILTTFTSDGKQGGGIAVELLSSTFIMITNLGVVCVFDLAYLINPTLFPTIYLATAYGACNVFGRFVTIFAPVAAEVGKPYFPLILLIVFAAITFIATRLLVILKDDKKKENMNDLVNS